MKIGGFTLIEAVVAILLTGLAILVVLSAFPWAQSIVKKGEYASIAIDIAHSKMEELKRIGYNSLVFGTQTFDVGELPAGQGKITISRYPSPTSQNLAKVDIEVSWQGGGGTSGKVQISSLISLY